MKWFLILTLLLTGCVREVDPVDTAANAAHQQIVAIKESLPKECQTKAIDNQLKAHDETLNTIVNTCNIQKAEIQSDKIKWKTGFFGLLLVMTVYILRKVLK